VNPPGGPRRRPWKIAVFVAATLINAAFLPERLGRAILAVREFYGLDNHQRRLLLWGNFYREILGVENTIPKSATVWLVTRHPPWYVNYYLYPRAMYWVATRDSDLDRVRSEHPSDWVLLYSRLPGQPELRSFPPQRSPS